MIKIKGLGHVNIVVDDINEAISFYKNLFDATPIQIFPHFKNIGFAKSAGFMSSPETVDVSIAFVLIEAANLFIELMEYHSPRGAHEIRKYDTNDMGGPRHICLQVENIDDAFSTIKANQDVRLISAHNNYAPYKIDSISSDEFRFFDESQEQDKSAKNNVCEIVGQIRYFYFIDLSDAHILLCH